MGKKHKRRRLPVDRAERIKPTPETLAKLKPWPLMLLLHQGPDAGGLDADEFEACIEIVETYRALTAELQVHGAARNELRGSEDGGHMSDRTAMMVNVWFAWSAEVGPVATQLVEQIEDAVPIRSGDVLRRAARRWLKLKHDMLRGLDKQPPRVLTSSRQNYAHGDRGHALPISHPPPPIRQVFSPAAGARAATQAAVQSNTPRSSRPGLRR